jgi:ferredoxin
MDDGCQAAHSNMAQHGKGRGIKASDEYTAALCQTCHYKIDQGLKLSKKERQDLWTEAHILTYNELKGLGLWPPEVPMPY